MLTGRHLEVIMLLAEKYVPEDGRNYTIELTAPSSAEARRAGKPVRLRLVYLGRR